ENRPTATLSMRSFNPHLDACPQRQVRQKTL
ncbi:hypothetical protein CEXT_527201, partial [Caerostris extrusa]